MNKPGNLNKENKNHSNTSKFISDIQGDDKEPKTPSTEREMNKNVVKHHDLVGSDYYMKVHICNE